jgi:hypothetical protein
MTTGVFFHETFKGKEWLIIGDKFRNFPGVMKHALKLPQVKLYSPEKVSEELLLKIHTAEFVQNLNQAWYCDGARYSVGGCVEATEKILSGELKNALVFTVAAGHHAERDSAWGGTYASCAGPAFKNAREKFGPKRFAILDTDRHHGNGTRDIFLDDDDVLHVCFCNWDRIEGNGSKVCINIAYPNTDEAGPRHLSVGLRGYRPYSGILSMACQGNKGMRRGNMPGEIRCVDTRRKTGGCCRIYFSGNCCNTCAMRDDK